ncbi:MAG: cytochrome c [Hydrogenophaga sp.]|jgi:cytochrome c553|nr:cytochrome c [Hydrogenophaga sp.]
MTLGPGSAVRSRRIVRTGVLALLSLAVAGAVCASERGLALYERGEYRVGALAEPLSGRAGADGSWVLRGAAVACANCHGLQAQGGGEGYQGIPPLRWPEWSSADPQIRAAASQRFERAVRQGLGASGQPLSHAMPRFDVSDEALQALASHVTGLATAAPVQAVPVFALLQLNDGAAPLLERELLSNLQRCLRERLGGRIRLETRVAESRSQAQDQWEQLARKPEVVAVLAPSWRGWQPRAGGGGLPALFPLTADPVEGVGTSHWLFGGERARAIALVQAWLERGSERSLPVWTGLGSEGERRWRELAPLAQAVAQQGGQVLRMERLSAPEVTTARPALWWAGVGQPGAGWWLVPEPLAPAPAGGSRWWQAQPYAGKTLRPLSLRWAEATCLTLDAVMSRGESVTRRNWPDLLGNTGRLNDGHGWEWRVPLHDAAGFGAAAAWSVVEFVNGDRARLITPRVDVGSPADTGAGPASQALRR